MRVLLHRKRRSNMEEKTFSKGDKVSWKSHGGTAHGKVVKKQTSPTQIKGHKVAASKNNPQYIVETDDGKKAAHKAEALKKG
jgi:uncharacterized protein YijF (DUF1287 family)